MSFWCGHNLWITSTAAFDYRSLRETDAQTESPAMKRFGIVILLLLVVPFARAIAACTGHPSTEVVITVDRCELIVPETHPELVKIPSVYGGIADQEALAQILESYRGAVLVERRDGTDTRTFVSSQDPKVCSKFKKGAKIRALVNDACCDGVLDVPCYLGFSALIEKLLPMRDNR